MSRNCDRGLRATADATLPQQTPPYRCDNGAHRSRDDRAPAEPFEIEHGGLVMSTGCQPDVGSAPKKLGRPDYATVAVCLVCALIVFAGIAFIPSSTSWSDPVGYTLAGIYLGFALREVFR